MTTLDEIQARADAAQYGWENYQSDGDADDAIIDVNNSAEDVPNLLAALRAVKALCTTSEEHAAGYGDTASIYVDDVRAAIRAALGS